MTWARENGRGMGILTHRVIQELEVGHAPPDAARLVYESNPIAPNGGGHAMRFQRRWHAMVSRRCL